MAPEKEKAPAFQFYVKEWRSSRSVQRMSFAERGMYLEMLLEQWESFSLPDSPEECAELLGGTVEEWVAGWATLRRKFTRTADGRLVNDRLEVVRRERRAFERFARGRARSGGIARARSANRGKDGTYQPASIQPQTSDPPASNQPVPASASASASVVPPNPPNGGRSGRNGNEQSRSSTVLTSDEEIADAAGRFLERYPAIYAKAREGAHYHVRAARDHPVAMELVAAYRDVDYLLDMLELFLRKDEWKPKNQPGSPGQFRFMAPQCDAELRRHGWSRAPRSSRQVS